MSHHETDILVIGAGIVGIATAYYLKQLAPYQLVTLIDQGSPMAFTSAQSGENYRNWWPHPTMKDFTNHSIDLMEKIAIESGDQINMSRRGYLLATRKDTIDNLIEELRLGYGTEAGSLLRFHTNEQNYRFPELETWQGSPNGVDVLQGHELIESLFPNLDKNIRHIIHIRRAGTISSQQLGQFMLDRFRAAGGARLTGSITAIDHSGSFSVSLNGTGANIKANQIVNAAGPFANNISKMLDITLPVKNILHQKIAFPDQLGTIPRKMPFAIDLDSQQIDWSAEERELLKEDSGLAWLADEMPGSIHCRPEGGDNGNWVKLGWAFNHVPSEPTFEPHFNEHFPEIVLRGAARLQPALKAYYGRLPRSMSLYGGYYTMTEENWPLIGPTQTEGFYINCAMSGFGTMAACASGELCAQWLLGIEKPTYAKDLSMVRYNNTPLMEDLNSQNTGVL